MKAHEALIAWTPLEIGHGTSGQVKVGRLIKNGGLDWTAPYSHTCGAAYSNRRSMRSHESMARLFQDFQYFVVEERLDPEAVHKAFLVIDEYADLFGARDE